MKLSGNQTVFRGQINFIPFFIQFGTVVSVEKVAKMPGDTTNNYDLYLSHIAYPLHIAYTQEAYTADHSTVIAVVQLWEVSWNR